MVCSSHVRIALTTKSQTHRNEALGKASRIYEVVLTHLSAPGLTYEELSCLNKWIADIRRELEDSFATYSGDWDWADNPIAGSHRSGDARRLLRGFDTNPGGMPCL